LRFFVPQGQHDSRISVKFGTAAVPISPSVNRLFGGFRPKKFAKNCQNFHLFRLAGANPLPDVDEIRKVYAGNRSTKAF